MLTEIEKNCVKELLLTLKLNDLSNLAKTCTNRVINSSNIDDCITAILLHTEDLRKLLMRKKITKNVLFKYLHSKNVSFPGSIEKSSLVELFIKMCKKIDAPIDSTNNQVVLEENNKNSILNSLALKFTEWFFNRLNTTIYQSINNENNSTDILLEEDFWPNAKLKIKLMKNVNEIVSEHNSESSKECFLLIKQICIEHSLFFSPNLNSEGTRGISNPHGLVLVMNCGTLHSGENGQNCVGIYEQMFILIKDPTSEQNWKIKLSELILRSQDVQSIPALSEDCEEFKTF